MLSREMDVYVMNSLSGRLENVTEQGRRLSISAATGKEHKTSHARSKSLPGKRSDISRCEQSRKSRTMWAFPYLLNDYKFLKHK